MELNFENYTAIPSHTQSALQRYVECGIMPGGFLQAVLSNDLMRAVNSADNYNRAAIPDIAKFVYNELPMAAHGSEEKIVSYCYSRQRSTFV